MHDDAPYLDARLNNLGPTLTALGFGPIRRWVATVACSIAPGLLDVIVRRLQPRSER